MDEHSPVMALRKASRECRLAWKSMAKWVTEARDKGIEWPSWCLVPDEFWYNISKSVFTDTNDPSRLVYDCIAIRILGSWRISKGIYVINKNLSPHLLSCDITGDFPTHVLKRLPEWCIYIDMPDAFVSEEFRNASGVWVRLAHSLDSIGSLDCIQVVVDGEPEMRCFNCPLSANSISEMVDSCIAHQDEIMSDYISRRHISGAAAVSIVRHAGMGNKESQSEMLLKVMNALLYICSSEPDIEDRQEPDARPSLARPKLVGKRDMFVAADRVRIWNVGDKVGEQIRKAREEPSDRAHTRRHLRRAHWHGYWTGARGSDERQFTYKWLSPMVVGVS